MRLLPLGSAAAVVRSLRVEAGGYRGKSLPVVVPGAVVAVGAARLPGADGLSATRTVRLPHSPDARRGPKARRARDKPAGPGIFTRPPGPILSVPFVKGTEARAKRPPGFLVTN